MTGSEPGAARTPDPAKRRKAEQALRRRLVLARGSTYTPGALDSQAALWQ